MTIAIFFKAAALVCWFIAAFANRLPEKFSGYGYTALGLFLWFFFDLVNI